MPVSIKNKKTYTAIKNLFRIFIGLILLSNFSTWYLTKEFQKPEKIIITQDKIIYKLQKDIQIKQIQKDEEYLIKIPFTNIGITKQFTLGILFDRSLRFFNI
jgi:hypothetical protein